MQYQLEFSPTIPEGMKQGRTGTYICRGRHTQRLRSNLQWENLPCNNPRDRSPRRSEEENVDADECYGCALGGEVRGEDFACGGVLACGGGAQDGDEELGDGHADCWGALAGVGSGRRARRRERTAPEEKGSATPFVDRVETWQGG